MKSIMHRKEDHTCFLCMILNDDIRTRKNLEEHHVFGGWSNRKLSEKYGLKVYLCHEHHTGDKGVHTDKTKAQLLHQLGQKKFEETYPDLEFRKIFGRNYL